MSRIKQLDEALVHQIAAGEVIVSPRNALKELLENAIDSGATKIDVIVADGGFKLLQISDNGSGIHRDDLEILCKRFTTSKIIQFKDLQSCTTLGFRGEALASISFISNLSVITKTRDNAVAIKALYDSGNLVDTKPIAGLDGTQLIVENLFYNNLVRKESLRNTKKTEYSAILDIVSRYAVHYDGTFSCKQHGDSQPTVIQGSSTIEKIKSVYGSAVSSRLLEVSLEEPAYGIQVAGYVSDLDYMGSKAIPFIFFVNGRLVECKPLQRALQFAYYSQIPKGNPFVYLSLKIDHENIDVNTHPTKSQVSFLYQEEIIAAIVKQVESTLLKVGTSRLYSTQTLLTSTSAPISTHTPQVHKVSTSGTGTAAQPRYEHKLVRTDPKQMTLAFARPTSKTSAPIQMSPRKSQRAAELNSSELATSGDELSDHSKAEFERPVTQVNPVNLESIGILKEKLNDSLSVHLTRILSQHTFIGVVDVARALAAIQYDVRLYLADYSVLSQAFFYQTALVDFANYGTIHLGSGLSVQELIHMHDSSAQLTHELGEMAPMLLEYFKIQLRFDSDAPSGHLVVVQMPLLLTDYSPSLARLPEFFYQLNQVNWDDEIECLDSILRAIAAWCVPLQPSKEDIKLIFEAMKTRFVAINDLKDSIVEIANLPGLYRVFERC